MEIAASGQVMVEGTFHTTVHSRGVGGSLHLAGQANGVAWQAHLTVENAQVIKEGDNTVGVVQSMAGPSGFIKRTVLGQSWQAWHGVALCKLIQNAAKDRTDFVFDFIDAKTSEVVYHMEGPIQGTAVIKP